MKFHMFTNIVAHAEGTLEYDIIENKKKKKTNCFHLTLMYYYCLIIDPITTRFNRMDKFTVVK